MSESKKFRSTHTLQQALAEAKSPWQKIGAYLTYALEAVTGGGARGYYQQMAYYDDLAKKRELTPAEKARYKDLRAMADEASLRDRL